MKRSSRWRRWLAGFLLLVLGLLALAGVSALVIRFAPPWLVSTKGLTGTARLQELNRVRVALVVIILGALAGGVALYLLRSSTRERREESHERELIERFTRAIDQLGHPALDVRLGGIYSLERLAREWPENHPPIVEILAAYVREHAQLPARTNGHRESRLRPPTDVQASLTVLGRRVLAYDNDAPVGLMHTALTGATLTGAHLERSLLSGSNLEGADLFKAHLNAADLEGANLRGAGLLLASLNDTVLWGANLEGARLYGASLEGAALKGANLRNAGLTGANLKDAGLHGAVLSGADLTGANLEGAGLEGANLEGANLQGANLRGAVLLNALFDEATSWPNGLDPGAQGAVRRAWPPEPAAWEGEVEEPVHPPAGGWPSDAPAGPETYAAREAYSPPQSQPDWPPAPAPASAWPDEASGEASDEALDDASDEESDEVHANSDPEPAPPPGWPNGQSRPDDEASDHDH